MQEKSEPPILANSLRMAAPPSVEHNACLGTVDASASGWQGCGDVLGGLLVLMANYDGDAENYPVADLRACDATERQFLYELLGRGEVCARIVTASDNRFEIQESAFTGLWRVIEIASDGRRINERLEFCPFPRVAWEEARAHARPDLLFPSAPSPELLQAAAVASEIADKMRQCDGQAQAIVFSSLPLGTDELTWLDALIGIGACSISSQGYGKCQARSTALANVWRVRYLNGMGEPLQDGLEFVRIPDAVVATAEDLADTRARLLETHAWLREGGPA